MLAMPSRQAGLPAPLIRLPLKCESDWRIPTKASTCITGTLAAHFAPNAKGTMSGASTARPKKAGNVTRLVSCVAS